MRRLLLAVAGFGLGLLLGFLSWGRGPARPPVDVGAEHVRPSAGAAPAAREAAAEAPEISTDAALRAQLGRETARAALLAEEVRLLKEELRRQQEVAAGGAEGGTGALPEPEDADAGAASSGPVPRREGGWLDEAALLEAGFHPSEIDALIARFEEIELARLYLRDKATREGWVDRPRFRRREAKLDARYDALRDEYGDDGYDWILYGAGRPNRVVTTHVMRDSPAAHAGLQPGDVFVAYGGRRIFGAAELQEATKTEGTPGDTVSVDVLRDGDELRFYVPVGPLGIQLSSTREKPAHGR